MTDFLKDVDAVKSALEELRKDGSPINWVAFGYADNEIVVNVLGSGSGDLKSVEHFFQPDKIVYVVFGYRHDEGGYTTLKYVLIAWVGTQVKAQARTRASQHRILLYSFVKNIVQLHGELHAATREDITEKIIAEKLTGSRYAEAATTTAPGTSAPSSKTSGLSTLSFQDPQAVQNAIAVVRDSSEPAWALFAYTDPNGDILGVSCTGKGYSSFASYLADDQVLYALLGIATAEADYSTIKFIFVTWVGPQVKPVPRARSSQHRVQLYDYIKQHLSLGGELQALSKDEISEEILRAKLSGAKEQRDELPVSPTRPKATRSDSVNKATEFQNVRSESLSVTFANQEEAATALQSLRDPKSHVTWIVFGYNEDVKDQNLIVLGTGSGGLEAASTHFSDHTVAYAVLAITFHHQDEYAQLKYVLLSWVGPKAKPVLKARSAQHRVSLYAIVNTYVPLAGEMQMMGRDDVSEELIKKKLIGTKILREEAGGSSGVEKTPPPKTTIEKLEFKDKNAVDALLVDVRNDHTKTNWVALGYSNPESQDKLEVIGSGAGDLTELLAAPCFAEDQVCYAVYGFVQEQGDYTQVKYLFVSWVGPKVKPLAKARASQIRVLLYQYAKNFLQLAGEVQATTKEELTEKALASKLTGSRMVTDAEAKTGERHERPRSSGGSERLQFANEEEALKAIQHLRDGQGHGGHWVLFGYQKDMALAVQATGTGGLDELKQHFTRDAVLYAILCYIQSEQVEEGQIYTTSKYLFISYVGPDVKPLFKARSSQHRLPLYQYALKAIPLHGQIHVEHADELTEHALVEKITGARTQDETKISAEATRLKLKKSEQQKSSTPKKEPTPSTTEPSSLALVFRDEESVVRALKAVRETATDAQTKNWVAFGYDGDGDDIIVLGTGTDGLTSLEKLFTPDAVVYAVLAVYDDESEAEGYATLKYIFISWVGPDVKPTRKALSSQHRVLLYNYAKKYLQLAGELQALAHEEISESILKAKLKGVRKVGQQ
jgi:hypothetical protein